MRAILPTTGELRQENCTPYTTECLSLGNSVIPCVKVESGLRVSFWWSQVFLSPWAKTAAWEGVQGGIMWLRLFSHL